MQINSANSDGSFARMAFEKYAPSTKAKHTKVIHLFMLRLAVLVGSCPSCWSSSLAATGVAAAAATTTTASAADDGGRDHPSQDTSNCTISAFNQIPSSIKALGADPNGARRVLFGRYMLALLRVGPIEWRQLSAAKRIVTMRGAHYANCAHCKHLANR